MNEWLSETRYDRCNQVNFKYVVWACPVFVEFQRYPWWWYGDMQIHHLPRLHGGSVRSLVVIFLLVPMCTVEMLSCEFVCPT